MSMLAEPRRKQKWSVDPRNSAWSNDDTKFGQKMLERMGWSKGKGLGRSEQGSTDHIKVKVKNDSYGLGANASHEDNWISHQDEFNDLLAQLNSCHGQNNSTETPPEEQKGFSLEEKSKTSKKRVHYMKFTKGKDLSSRSETDLNCIFGKRAKSTKVQEQESNSSDSLGETEENVVPAPSEFDTETITKTVTSTLTMQEYFAQRMTQLKKARGAQGMTSSSSGPSEDISSSSYTEEPTKKKKKKKKKVAADEVEEDSSTPITVVNHEEPERSKKKKKKRKMAERECDMNVNCSSPLGTEADCKELPPAKKKKQREDIELQNGQEHTENQTLESHVVQKKKKKGSGEAVDSVVTEETSGVVKKKSKKKKKQHEKNGFK
ncbi:PIN2/TERF1-interacting telomerase inhibitor 1 [Pholidichthys leucotaenia]